MHADTSDIFDKEIFTTKKPFVFYLTAFLWGMLLILFFVVIKIRELEGDGLLTAAVVFLFFALYIYIVFGRYLATVTFYDHQIEINYIFPWNRNTSFRFEKLTAIEFREFELLDRLTRGWYRGGKWLYLKNEKEEVCQFKYNINPSDNKRFLEELQKKCIADIVYS